MSKVIDDLYEIILSRKESAEEGSYTGYLFAQGLDKILKKCGEESSEVLIAAKNGVKADLVGEIGDLVYHLLVLMAETGVTLDEVYALLEERSKTIGNLKPQRETVKES
ncbi:MAG: phosphoribosyl-ATP diphosphatase [Clostridiales bacterium]|nr:phosphoribosyl-ATP diphosphatase [Clostridiales bacterium]